MITLTLQFNTFPEFRSFVVGNGFGSVTPADVKFEVSEPDAKLAAAAPAEVIEKTMDAPGPDLKKSKTKGPAKKATKGTAAKKNEAQARAAAKLKAAEQETESGDLGLDETTPTPAEPVVTKKEVDTALRAYAQQYQMTGARALIALFKKSDGTPIANARELREEDYAAFVAAAQKAPVAQEA